MVVHEFEEVIRRLHDDLYASSKIKTPEALQSEVAKVVVALVASVQGRTSPRPAMAGDQATWVRTAYAEATQNRPDWDLGDIELEDANLLTALERLSPVDFTSPERDFLGDALEVMRSTDAKRLGGQFFTDQRVTQLTLALLDYDPAAHDFLDVCAGTGGFLIPAAQRARATENARPILGIEIDQKIMRLANATLSHLALTHLANGTSAEVVCGDSLANPELWSADLSTVVAPGGHLRLASNPPFGAKIKIRDIEVLRQFDLARHWTRQAGTWIRQERLTARPPEVLFVERNLQLLLPGEGRMGLVLPYQILSGPQLGFIRQWLLMNARVLAVVDLPGDTFQPWTGTKASVLVAERLSSPLTSLNQVEDLPVFMALPRKIGHDRRGNPIRRKTGDVDEDLSSVETAYGQYLAGQDISHDNPTCFVISARQIAADTETRFNAAFYRPRATALRTSLERTDHPSLRVARLGDLVERVFCPGRFKRNYVASGGIPFLGGSNISQFAITTDKSLSADDPHLPELLVREGWILVTRSGSTGIVSRVPSAWDGYAMSEHIIRIIPRREEDLPVADYLEAFLRSEWGQRLLASGVFGSVIDEITPEFVADLHIPVPTDTRILQEIAAHVREGNQARDITSQELASAGREVAELLKVLAEE